MNRGVSMKKILFILSFIVVFVACIVTSGNAMQQNIFLLILAYVIIDIPIINTFFTQRAALDIGRTIGIDIRPIVYKPNSLITICRIINLCILGYMFYQFPWYYAVIVCVLDLLFTSIVPVPQSKYDLVEKRLKLLGINIENKE